jgi:phenylalanyl-tRNA synthetase beta chain
MTISYNWLKDFIDLPEAPEEIGHALTSTGLEVESIAEVEMIKGGLKGLVIGEVITCERHPNADKLSLTTVDAGSHEHLKIVCGAPNVQRGQKVIVAMIGVTLYPSHGEPFTIKKTKIRGEESNGMICAEDEIGLGENHDGIIVLSTSLPNGTPAAVHFNVTSDHAYEIGLTPNRADAASHLGVARDLRALLGRKITLPSIDAFQVDNKALTIDVLVENTEACPRYSAVTITGIKVSESPEWLKTKLATIGLTPINNVVDITNYVCHELGQPLHAFDADQISANKVVVKTLDEGSKFVTLDTRERTLRNTDLMICNGTEGMCIAGVFGGLHSGITSTSTNIFLESAYFSSEYVRRTAMYHQLKTDASFRFERGTDPNMTVFALKRAAILIKEIAGGKISSDVVDVYPTPVAHRTIRIKDTHLTRLIGKEIPRKEVLAILDRLDIKMISEDPDSFTVSVPPFRVDVIQEADVIEEVLRIYGFNNIPLSTLARTDYLAEFPVHDINTYKRRISELLVSSGFYEIWTNSLTNLSYQTRHRLRFDGEPVEVLNKLSEEQGILRQTLLFTGLEVAAYNINRRQRDLKLFEFGKVYYRDGQKYREIERLALYVTGEREAETWQRASQASSYYDVAQHVHHILVRSGARDVIYATADDPILEYGSQLSAGKVALGKVGKVKSALLKDFGIKQDLFYVELDTSLLFQSANPKLVIQEITKYPEVRRDVSLVLDKQVSFDEIKNLVMQTEKQLVKSIVAFDVYEGKNIPQGKKAYALAFTLLHEQRTLTDEEIDKAMEKLMAAFEKKLGAVIRK